MLMTLSARLAQRMAATHGLTWRKPPVEVRHTRLSLVFHRRLEADAGHAWLRRLILAEAREAGGRQAGNSEVAMVGEGVARD
jgi:hypothetical protein